MIKYKDRRVSLLVGMLIIVLSGCVTASKVVYKKDLSLDPRLEQANTSYKKALRWIEDAQREMTPYKAHESYITASSYLSDTIFKLKRLETDYKLEVKEYIDYCEKVKGEIHAQEGIERRKMMR